MGGAPATKMNARAKQVAAKARKAEQDRLEDQKRERIRAKCEREVADRKQALFDVRWVQSLLVDPFFHQDKFDTSTRILLCKAALDPITYDEISSERACEGICGYFTCNKAIDESRVQGEKTYKLVGRDHKVIDADEYAKYCNKQCFTKSATFRAQLLSDAPYMRDLS